MKKILSLLFALTIVMSVSAVPASQARPAHASKMQFQRTEKVMLGQTIAPRAEKKAFVKQEKATQPQVRRMKADSSKVVAQYSVAAAIQEVNEGRILDDDEIIIEGIITKIEFKGKNFKKYGSANIYVKDVHGLEGEFEFYNCYSLLADTFRTSDPEYDASSTSWASFESVTDGNGVTVKVGDQVTAQGKFKLYNGVYELNTGCYLTHIETPEQSEIPTEDVLGYQPGMVGVCIYVPKEIACNEIVFVGTYNNWDDNADNCVRFAPVMGYEDWYYTAIYDDSEEPEGKPVILDKDGQFNWEFQVGAATKISGGAEVIPGAYAGEIDIKYYGKDAVNYYSVDAWKINPCNIGYYNYTIVIAAPDACPEMKPALVGDFNGWNENLQMDAALTEDSTIVYYATINAIPGSGFKFREASTETWENELLWWYEGDEYYEAGWYTFNNFILPDTQSDMSLEYDFSNNDLYRFALCESEIIPTGDTIRIDFAEPMYYGYYPGDPGDWYFYAENDQYKVQLDVYNPDATSPAGSYTINDVWDQYTWVAVPVDTTWLTYFVADAQIEVIESENRIDVQASLLAEDGVVYEVTMFYDKPDPVVPTREEDLVVEDAQLDIYEGAWQIRGFDTTAERYVNIASYSDVVAGDYILSQLAWARIAVFTSDTSYVWYDGTEVELSVAYDEETTVAQVTGWIIAAYGEDAVKFNVEITTAAQPTGKQYDEEEADFAAEFAEYTVYEDYIEQYGEVLIEALNDSLQYLLLDVVLPEGATELVPGIYPVSGEGVRPSVWEGDYSDGTLYSSYAMQLVEIDGTTYWQNVWFFTEGYVEVYEDGSILITANNSYGRNINCYLAARHIEDEIISVHEAVEIGSALGEGEKTEATYRVRGYTVNPQAYNESYGTQVFFMSDHAVAPYGEFEAYRCYIDAPGTVTGDYVEVVGQITKYVNASGKVTIEINGGDAEVLIPASQNTYYLAGTMNNWSVTDGYQFIQNPSDPNEYYLNITLEAGDELKAIGVADGAIVAWYPWGEENYIVDAAHAGTTTIYFRPNRDGGADWYFGFIYVPTTTEKLYCGDNLTWTLVDGVLTIEGTGAMWDYETVGPWGDAVTEVNLPEGLTYIGACAFEGCYLLTNITIPSTVEEIGHYAFYYTGLQSLYIPATVQVIGQEAFAYNYYLTDVRAEYNPNLGWYGNGLFAGCNNIMNIEVPVWYMYQIKSKNLINVVFTVSGRTIASEYIENLRLSHKTLQFIDFSATSLTVFPDEILRNCYNLTCVVLPQNINRIGFGALAECKMLQSINIPASVVEIGPSAFEDCRSMTLVEFEQGSRLESIGNWAFYNCHSLPEITIPDGVMYIGDGAFYGCVYAEKLNVPASVVAIGDNAFALCSKLAEMEVKALLPPEIMAKTFYEVSREAPVYVPDESVDIYLNHILWSELNIQGASKKTEGLSNVGAGEKVQKIVRDGHVFILRGDRIFTTTGVEVK